MVTKHDRTPFFDVSVIAEISGGQVRFLSGRMRALHAIRSGLTPKFQRVGRSDLYRVVFGLQDDVANGPEYIA